MCQQRCTIRSAHRDVEATDAYSKQDSERMCWRRMVIPFCSSCCASRLSKSPNPQTEAACCSSPSSLPNQSKLERHDWYKPSVIITSKGSLDANHHLRLSHKLTRLNHGCLMILLDICHPSCVKHTRRLSNTGAFRYSSAPATDVVFPQCLGIYVCSSLLGGKFTV